MKKKNILIVIIMCLSILNIQAQDSKKQESIEELPEVYISKGIDLLFISPEPIEFVDLSTNNLIGDLPTDNIARVKIDSEKKYQPLDLNNGQKSYGVITIVGQSFMAQYKTVFNTINNCNPITNIQIQPEDMQPLEFLKMGYSVTELKTFSESIFTQKKVKRKPLRKTKSFKLKLQLNNAYVFNDYIFLDVSIFNKSNIHYNVEDIKFTIEDKKIYKATNNQTVTLEPICKLFDKKKFRRKYRNIFVFRKFTFPNGKILKIRVLESPISGRSVELDIKYSDILNADVF